MKKVYLSVVLCCLAFAGYSTNWYSADSAGVGNAASLTHWWSSPDSTGTHPTTFADAGDVWIMQTAMSCSTSLAIGGALVINNVYFNGPKNTGGIGEGILTIGGNLTLTGGGVISEPEADGEETVYDQTINIGGNLSVTGSAYFTNPDAYTIIAFNNTSSTFASPQTISWVSTESGAWTRMHINAGCFVKLLSNVTMPELPGGSDIVDGALICDNYIFDCNTTGYQFVLNSGASLYTGNPYGVDSTIRNEYGFSYSSSANYIFNGVVPQATGMLMPSSFFSPGSVTVSNAPGAALSKTTTFYNSSTLALAGRLVIGSNDIVLDVDASITGTFTGGSMIVANSTGVVNKHFDEEGAMLFPIGDNLGNYSPISIDVTGGSYSGAFVAVNVTNAKHPNNANLTDYLSRYWTVTTSSGLDYAVTAAAYIPDDVTGTEANLSMGQYTGSLPWVKFGTTNILTHTLSSTSVNNPTSYFTGISTAPPAVTVTPSTAICYGNNTLLSMLTITGDTPLTFVWSPETGLSSTTDSIVTATPTSTTTYTLTVTDANGFTGFATTTVSVNPLPNVYEVTGGGSYCEHTGGVAMGLSGSDTGIRYQQYRNDTLTGSAFDGTESAIDFGMDTLEGEYTVVATDTITGCTSNMSGSQTVTMIPTVVPTVTIMPSIMDTICEGTTVYFSFTTTGEGFSPAYEWAVNGTPITSFTPVYGYVPVNGDVVSLRLISSAMCAMPDTVTGSYNVSVSTHRAPTVSLSVSPNDTVCEGTGVIITAAPTFGGTAPTYVWVKNTVPADSGATYSFIPADGDDVYCIMTSNYFCKTTPTAYSNVISMSVQNPALSIPAVDIAALHGTLIGKHQPDTLVATVMNGGSSYSIQWYLNGAAVPGATTLIFVKTSFTDKDSVSCTVIRHDACGMSTYNSVVILVSGVGVAPVGTGAGDIKLMPNPNNGTFTVKGSIGVTTDAEVSLEVTDVLGQVVYSNKVKALNGNIDEQIQPGKSLANGMYLLNLRSESGNTTLRFVVAQ